ncbi:MAG: hypothetical protein KJ613_00960 [Nanoarchaeota archaeon]|nr:hypothetical protein [Nanoarchaeota archaeon]
MVSRKRRKKQITVSSNYLPAIIAIAMILGISIWSGVSNVGMGRSPFFGPSSGPTLGSNPYPNLNNNIAWPEMGGNNQRHFTQYGTVGHDSYSNYEHFGRYDDHKVKITKHDSLIYGSNMGYGINDLVFYDVDTFQEKYSVHINDIDNFDYELEHIIITEDKTGMDQNGDGVINTMDAVLALKNNIIYGTISYWGNGNKGEIFSIKETPNGAELLNVIDSDSLNPRAIIASNKGIFILSNDGRAVNHYEVTNDLRFYDFNLNEQWSLKLEDLYDPYDIYFLINGKNMVIDSYDRLWIVPTLENYNGERLLVFNESGNVLLNEQIGTLIDRVIATDDRVYVFSITDMTTWVYDQLTLDLLWEGSINTNPGGDIRNYGASYNKNTGNLNILKFVANGSPYEFWIQGYSTRNIQPEFLWEKNIGRLYISPTNPISDASGKVYIFYSEDDVSDPDEWKLLIMDPNGGVIFNDVVLNPIENCLPFNTIDSLMDKKGNLYFEFSCNIMRMLKLMP